MDSHWLHATWADAEGRPKLIHAFLPPNHDGYRIVETWNGPPKMVRFVRAVNSLFSGWPMDDVWLYS